MVTTAFGGKDSIYKTMVEQEKLFPSMWNLFALGLVNGILHNIKSTKRRGNDLFRLNQLSEEPIRDVIDICYKILDDGRNEKEIFNEMLSFADAGVEDLYKDYEKNGSLQLPKLIEDSKNLWNKRVKDLHNINLKK